MLPQVLLAALPLLAGVFAGDDGSITGPTSSASAANYSCDASKCKLPDCNCASTDPPGGLDPVSYLFSHRSKTNRAAVSTRPPVASADGYTQSVVPQFVVFTADDAIQSYTLDSVNQFLAQRKNPNGCVPRMTYYTSLNYTNYTLVTDWFVAGNEIADHTYVLTSHDITTYVNFFSQNDPRRCSSEGRNRR